MTSVMHLTLSELLDLELRMRGTSLNRWCASHGMTDTMLVEMLQGTRREVPEIRLALEEELGCDIRKLMERIV